MCTVIRKLFLEAKHGFLDGVTEAFHPSYDKQEQARQTLLRHIEDTKWADSDVHHEFLQYCRSYDRKLRLNRTNEVLDAMLDKRPAIRERLTSKKG